MILPTTLSASFAMVSPIYALPRLSGTCTLNQLLAFQPSTLLPTCFFFAMVSPGGFPPSYFFIDRLFPALSARGYSGRCLSIDLQIPVKMTNMHLLQLPDS